MTRTVSHRAFKATLTWGNIGGFGDIHLYVFLEQQISHCSTCQNVINLKLASNTTISAGCEISFDLSERTILHALFCARTAIIKAI